MTIKSIISYIKGFIKPETKDIYLIEVIYKSGKAKMFWCTSFTAEGSTYKYERYYTEAYPDKGEVYPMVIGNSEIAAFWQVGTMKVKV